MAIEQSENDNCVKVKKQRKHLAKDPKQKSIVCCCSYGNKSGIKTEAIEIIQKTFSVKLN